jgi:hypothetical protein
MPTNVSSLVPPQVGSTLATVNSPQAFGSQVKDAAKQKIISVAVDKLGELKQKLEEIAKKKIELEVRHRNNLKKLGDQYQPKPPATPVLTQAEYEVAVVAENASYEIEKKGLTEQDDKTKEQIQSITQDPEIEQKKKRFRLKSKIQRKKKKSKADKIKAAKTLLRNISKTLGPLIAYSAVIIITKLISQNLKLQELVDQTNEIIDNAQTPTELDQARVSRNSAYNVLDSNERSFTQMQDRLITIQLIVTITELLIPLLNLAVPPPIPLIRRLQEALALIGFILPIIISILEPVIAEFEDLKAQLRDVDNRLDLQTINSNSLASLNALLADIKTPVEGMYKGFKLVIKEDNDPKTIVRGVKRHYAVAINRSNVEVVKSDYSYTLEPPVLIDQLKIIIDQQNLQG